MQFLLNKTKSFSTWYIVLDNWIVAAAYIDDEDLFAGYVSNKLSGLKVKEAVYDTLGHYGKVYVND
jgi:hypothetical protein